MLFLWEESEMDWQEYLLLMESLLTEEESEAEAWINSPMSPFSA